MPNTVADNMRQLVQLRWIAVGGQFVTIIAVHFGLGVPLPLLDMLGLVALLAVANLITLLALPRHRVTNFEITLALLLDMAALTIQLYLSGGVTNPFILLLLLQVVLGAILLEGPLVWLLVAAAALCFAGLGIEHRPLRFPAGLSSDIADLTTLGAWLGFALAAGLLTVFIGRISRNLRARDIHLAEFRRRTLEEDSIVRMGLFASGAAHELGTPLATLSVILADWRRVSAIADDPDLAAELADMQTEVERCKVIVSAILHSAGEPRGQAMASVPAAAFLDVVVNEWCESHGRTLEQRRAVEPEAALVAEPALRQAIWNLLDNAVEASPLGVRLTAASSDGTLVIAISDKGPGFTPDQLARVGRPHLSTKSDGHGMGLFLASNVARRLGGRLEANNLPLGGAEVRLVLPLVARRNTGA
jgi:two-component system sensor histidine kinase RegB